jgi:hypothetical protein
VARVAVLVAVFLSLAATAVAEDRLLERVSVGNGDFDARLQGVSADGTRAFFQTFEELVPEDQDVNNQDVYWWTPAGINIVSDTIGTDEERNAEFKGASLDGSRAFFETAESHTSADTNNITDVYSLTGIGTLTPELERVSVGEDGGGGLFLNTSEDGTRAFFVSDKELTPDDNDGTLNDIFLRHNDGTGAATTLVTEGEISVNPSPVGVNGISADGTHVFFTTRERLLPGDTDASSQDVYERQGAITRLVSTGGNDAVDAQFTGTSADGSRAWFVTDEQLVGADNDAARDVYERSGGSTTLISTDGADVPAGFVGASRDGTRVIFTTTEVLAPSDTDTDLDLYERAGGMLRHLSSGPTSSDPIFGAALIDISDDGSRVFFTTDERLVAADTDSVFDMYERTAGGIALVSTGEMGGNGAFPAQSGRANADGSRVFFFTAEQLSPLDTDGQTDVYERTNGITSWVPGGNGAFPIIGLNVPAQGDRVFVETADQLLPNFDSDARVDVYAARLGTAQPPPPNPTPTPPGNEPPGDEPPLVDSLAPGLGLSGKAVQKILQQGAVVVLGSCDEACTLIATGTLSVPGASKVYRLRRARRSASAGTRVMLRLKVPRKAVSAARKALRRGRRVQARVTIVALDAAGNRRTATRRIRARR